MAAELKSQLANADIDLIPGGGGVFEVTVNGVLVFSKAKLHRFPEPGEVLRLLNQ